MGFFKNLFKKKIDKKQQEVEEEFSKGNILLPTGTRDYEDYDEFKEKTSHLPEIQDSLKKIKDNNPENKGKI